MAALAPTSNTTIATAQPSSWFSKGGVVSPSAALATPANAAQVKQVSGTATHAFLKGTAALKEGALKTKVVDEGATASVSIQPKTGILHVIDRRVMTAAKHIGTAAISAQLHSANKCKNQALTREIPKPATWLVGNVTKGSSSIAKPLPRLRQDAAQQQSYRIIDEVLLHWMDTVMEREICGCSLTEEDLAWQIAHEKAAQDKLKKQLKATPPGPKHLQLIEDRLKEMEAAKNDGKEFHLQLYLIPFQDLTYELLQEEVRPIDLQGFKLAISRSNYLARQAMKRVWIDIADFLERREILRKHPELFKDYEKVPKIYYTVLQWVVVELVKYPENQKFLNKYWVKGLKGKGFEECISIMKKAGVHPSINSSFRSGSKL